MRRFFPRLCHRLAAAFVAVTALALSGALLLVVLALLWLDGRETKGRLWAEIAERLVWKETSHTLQMESASIRLNLKERTLWLRCDETTLFEETPRLGVRVPRLWATVRLERQWPPRVTVNNLQLEEPQASLTLAMPNKTNASPPSLETLLPRKSKPCCG
jgi:hypothetical protein